jgi:hypothetical protein
VVAVVQVPQAAMLLVLPQVLAELEYLRRIRVPQLFTQAVVVEAHIYKEPRQELLAQVALEVAEQDQLQELAPAAQLTQAAVVEVEHIITPRRLVVLADLVL